MIQMRLLFPAACLALAACAQSPEPEAVLQVAEADYDEFLEGLISGEAAVQDAADDGKPKKQIERAERILGAVFDVAN